MHATKSPALRSVAALLVLLVGCGKSEEEKQRDAWQKAAEAVGEAIAASADQQEATIDPGLRLFQRTHTDGRTVCWQITNRNEDPVTIHRVVFNGEWDAPIADWRWMPSFYMNKPVEEPQYSETLTIGESCLFFHKSAHANEHSYWKEVIYIDLYTDRGDFRYRPFEGFKSLEK